MSTTGTTSEQKVSITDPSFSKENSTGYQLIIASQPEKITLALHQIAENKFTALQEMKAGSSNEIQKELAKLPYHKMELANVLAAYATPLVSLFPESIAETKKHKELLGLNHKLTESKIYSDHIPGTGITQLYQPNEDILSAVKSTFPQAKTSHFSTGLLSVLSAINKSSNKNSAYLYLHHEKFQVIIFQSGKLIFSNWFDFTTKEDVLYYLLYSLEQLSLHTDTTSLRVMGNISRSSDLYIELGKYFSEHSIQKAPAEMKFTAPLQKLELHKWFGVFCQPANAF